MGLGPLEPGQGVPAIWVNARTKQKILMSRHLASYEFVRHVDHCAGTVWLAIGIHHTVQRKNNSRANVTTLGDLSGNLIQDYRVSFCCEFFSGYPEAFEVNPELPAVFQLRRNETTAPPGTNPSGVAVHIEQPFFSREWLRSAIGTTVESATACATT